MKIQSQLNVTTTYKTEADFDGFMNLLRSNVDKLLDSGIPVFNTGNEGIWDRYLNSFPKHDRQEYNCRCCKSFINNYGGLTYINTEGVSKSVLWADDKRYGFFRNVVSSMRKFVEASHITSQFFTSKDETCLGRTSSGGWTHLWIDAPNSSIVDTRIKTASAQSAQSVQDYEILREALEEFSDREVDKAYSLAMSGKLDRVDKFKHHLEWLSTTYTTFDMYPSNRSNLLWSAVADAKPGYVNVKTSISGMLMSDLRWKSKSSAVDSFNRAIDPVNYQRVKSLATAGNVARGEKVIEALGFTKSLPRRWATLKELILEWEPKPVKSEKTHVESSVFGNMKLKVSAPAKTTNADGLEVLSYTRFRRVVLPNAERIEVLTPDNGAFTAMVAPVNTGSPSMFRWDNSISTYVYAQGSAPSSWNLGRKSWVDVIGITKKPSEWSSSDTTSATFLLKDCHDMKAPGLALFPEILCSELHEVRKTIENYSNANKMGGQRSKAAAGITLSNNSDSLTIRVTDTHGVVKNYSLDRAE